MSAKRVFISYAWNDPELDKEWVHDFVGQLRKDGIEASFDEFELQKRVRDLSNMMLDSFYKSDFIIPILTKLYAEKSNSDLGGVGTEKILTTRMILDEELYKKVIPIKKSKDTKNCIPQHLDKIEFFDFSEPSQYDDSYNSLLHRILDVEIYEKNQVGQEPKLKTRKIKYRFKKIEVEKTEYGKLIKKHLHDLGYHLANLSENCFQNVNTIIYPVVPRDTLTIIHQSQLEVIKFLIYNFNWKCHILITNCGSEFQNRSKLAIQFKDEINNYCIKRKVQIKNIEYSFLNDYFFDNGDNNDNKKEILTDFVDISTSLTLDSLRKLNEKDYSEQIKDQKRKQPLIDTLRPVLTISVTKLLCQQTRNVDKPVILAGEDELNQWIILFRSNEIGAILNPILEVKDSDDANHEDLLVFWTESTFRKKLDIGNFYYWAFTSFIALHYNSIPFEIFKGELSNTNIIEILNELKSKGNAQNLNKEKFSEYVYGLLNMG